MYKLPFSIIFILIFVFYLPLALFQGKLKREGKIAIAIQKAVWNSNCFPDLIVQMSKLRTSDYER